MATLKSQGYNIEYEVIKPLISIEKTKNIIFANGNFNCIKDWHTLGYVRNFQKILPGYQLILMDALGYGDSDKPLPPDEYTSERRAEDVIAVLDHLNINQAHFFGISLGGSLGFALAALYQNRFLSFSIAAAHPYGISRPNIGYNLFGEDFKDTVLSRGMLGFVTDLEELIGQRFPEKLRVEYLKNSVDAVIAANTPIWPDYSSALRSITVPVLLIAGDKDPVSEYQQEIADTIPNAQVTLLLNTDHCDCYWNSEKTVPVIAKFITSI